MKPEDFLRAFDDEYHRLKREAVSRHREPRAKDLVNWMFDHIGELNAKEISLPERELLSKALEGMSQEPLLPPESNSKAWEYAAYMAHHTGGKRAWKQASEMIRMKPMTLWTVYPDYFPEPPKKEGADD